jgi:clan AA aspartic protease (TIGR02281 family)
MAEQFFDNKRPMIPVMVTLNGKKGVIRVQGIIDTGATFVSIPYEIAESLGYDLHKINERAQVSTPNGLITVPLITMDEVNVMGKSVPQVKVAVLPFPEEARVCCLVGLSFLRNFSFTIEYATGTIKLE